jgi:PhoPQ-activated pathogenicity-related protein
MDDPPMQKLRSWVDPYAYRARYTMPKLLLLGTNDPYWTVDSLRHYWDELPGPKLLFQTPNAGHDLAGGQDALQTLAAFFQIVADGQPLPRMTWRQTGGPGKAAIEVTTDQPAAGIRLWTATSKDRDFRDETWASRALEVNSGSASARATVETPDQGYRAYLAEVELRSPTGHPYKLSTEARVTPDRVR